MVGGPDHRVLTMISRDSVIRTKWARKKRSRAVNDANWNGEGGIL